MSITGTTLSAAIGATDLTLTVASATGITAPNFTTGVGITYLFCEQEMMLVTGVNGTVINVQRGYGGTPASAHGVTAPIISGLPTDFSGTAPAIKAQQDFAPNFIGFGAPVASAATIVASGPLFHVTGGTAINIITPPTGMIEGEITIVFDSTCTWTSSAVANGIFASGTSTTAGSAVTFYLDAGSSRWYPSRLA